MKNLFPLLLSLLSLFPSCKSKTKPHFKEPNNLTAFNQDNSLKNLHEMQVFEIDPQQDTVLEGVNGTMISMPAGSFVDSNGNLATGKVRIELLESAGAGLELPEKVAVKNAFYLNAKSGEQQLHINPDNPIYVELPTAPNGNDVLYAGTRGPDGKLNWAQQPKPEQYLIPIDLDQLDFLPAGFYSAVQNSMPWRGHAYADKVLVDSMYYALSAMWGGDIQGGIEYTKQNHGGEEFSPQQAEWLSAQNLNKDTSWSISYCGIDPAIIKTLHDKKFQNTYIATREFEDRLKRLHNICKEGLIEVYLKYASDNLWQADEELANTLGKDNPYYQSFVDDAKLRLTNVKNPPKSAALLKKCYDRRLENNKVQIKMKYERMLEKRRRKEEIAQREVEEYRDLLQQRSDYRYSKMGFTKTDLGWTLVGAVVKTVGHIQVEVEGYERFDQHYVYWVNPAIQSTWLFQSSNGGTYIADNPDSAFVWKSDQPINVIGVFYMGGQAFWAKETFTYGGGDINILLHPQAVSAADLKAHIKEQGHFKWFNKIEKDLEYQAFFHKDNLRREEEMREDEIMRRLLAVARPCYECNTNGKLLFEQNCSSCHMMNQKLTAPPVADAMVKYDLNWLTAFTRNSQAMVYDKDPQAVALWKANKPLVMPPFEHLTDEEIKAIYLYIDAWRVEHNTPN